MHIDKKFLLTMAMMIILAALAYSITYRFILGEVLCLISTTCLFVYTRSKSVRR